MALNEDVRVAERDPHPAGERLEPGVALERVHPHEPVGLAVQAPELGVEEREVAALPAVRDDDGDGTARQAAAAVLLVVGPERLADARAAAPVRHGRAGEPERVDRVEVAQTDGVSREAGASRTRTPRRGGRPGPPPRGT